jgi:hypothetical protein
MNSDKTHRISARAGSDIRTPGSFSKTPLPQLGHANSVGAFLPVQILRAKRKQRCEATTVSCLLQMTDLQLVAK